MHYIIQDDIQHEFYIEIESQRALVGYRFVSDNLVDFYHTFVPSQFRGKGYATAVVRAGLDWARENNLKVIAGCSFVYAFLERNKEYKTLLE